MLSSGEWSAWIEHAGGGRPRVLEGKYVQARFQDGEVVSGYLENPGLCWWPSSWHHDLISRLLYVPYIRCRYRKTIGFAMLERIAANPDKIGSLSEIEAVK